MGILARLGDSLGARREEKRKASRRACNIDAWVREDGSFAMQPCKLVDISSKGVRISIERPEQLNGTFLLMTSRDGSSARRVRMKWRRGNQIGAEFI
jgi:hypothetical protein